MIKNQYINTIPYEVHNHKGANYRIKGHDGFCNHGNLCESIVKYHRGLDYMANDNISGMVGYDIPEERIEVKSSAASLGRDIGERSFTVSQQISYYFKHAPKGKRWMWVEFDEKTQIVTEYIMNKREFGGFLHVCLRRKTTRQSNKKSESVRFKKTTREMIAWLESHCVEAA